MGTSVGMIGIMILSFFGGGALRLTVFSHLSIGFGVCVRSSTITLMDVPVYRCDGAFIYFTIFLGPPR